MILLQAAEYKEQKKQRELEKAAEEQLQPSKAKAKGSPKKQKKQAKSLE